jgi:hypothetical protein
MTAKQAIDIINRRAATMQRLLGAHSDEFELFSTDMTNYDIYTNSKGQLQIRNTAENRKDYRRLTAWAKRIQKMPVQVIQRQAAKKYQDYQEYAESADESDILDYDTYNQWLKDFNDYNESCYDLASRELPDGELWEIIELARKLLSNRDEYVKLWNKFYKNGDFDKYKKMYEEQQFYQSHTIDPITGEVTEKNDYRSL